MRTILIMAAMVMASMASAAQAAIEVRAQGDLDADGKPDTAQIVATDDTRRLTVTVGGRAVGTLDLDSAPLGPAEIGIRGGVLVVKDLTGGTSAIAATYRYRYDATAKAMRLIGLDATSYSRTFQHDSYEISWNLLTGDFVTRYSHLKPEDRPSDEAYDRIVEKKRKRPSKPLYLGTTPDPSEVINAETWPAS